MGTCARDRLRTTAPSIVRLFRGEPPTPAGPASLLRAVIKAEDFEPGALRAAAALVSQLDADARERVLLLEQRVNGDL
jgi:hypothetical protein